MSDIILNNNTYNGVTSVKLMKADNTGYATYTEDAQEADTLLDTMLNRESVGDITSDNANPLLTWMRGLEFGTVSFPNATKMYMNIGYCKFANLLLPNVTQANTYIGKGKQQNMLSTIFTGNIVTGVLDLSSLTTVQNNTLKIDYCRIETVKLGNGVLSPNSGMFTQSEITNLIWNVSETNMSDSGLTSRLNAATSITNLYVPSERVSAIQALVTGGTITKVTNVYSIADWSD